jgi:hypothetical protein
MSPRSLRTGSKRHPFFFPSFLSFLFLPSNTTAMASNIPAALKSADIGRFALRAAQIERVKPVVAYWCEFPPPEHKH